MPFDSVRRFSVQAAAMAKNFNSLEIPVGQLVSWGQSLSSRSSCRFPRFVGM